MEKIRIIVDKTDVMRFGGVNLEFIAESFNGERFYLESQWKELPEGMKPPGIQHTAVTYPAQFPQSFLQLGRDYEMSRDALQGLVDQLWDMNIRPSAQLQEELVSKAKEGHIKFAEGVTTKLLEIVSSTKRVR